MTTPAEDQEYWEATHKARGKRKWRIRPEDALQILCVKLLRSRHIPFLVCQPERISPPIDRRDWLKKLGVLGNAGAVEIIIFMPSRTLLVELKTEKGVLSDDQVKWHKRLPEPPHIIRSIEDFVSLIGYRG